MKKTLLLILVLFSAYLGANAQEALSPRFTIGGNFGAAVGSNTSQYPVAIQLNARVEYPIAQSQLALVGVTGIGFFVSSDGYNYNYNSSYGTTTSGSIATFVPLQIGARYYINKLFIEADAGASFNLGVSNNPYSGSNKITEVAPLVTPSVGYGFRFGRSGKIGLDLSVGYEARLDNDATIKYYGSFNQAFFRVAFSLGL